MTTTSFKMNRRSIVCLVLTIITAAIVLVACQKGEAPVVQQNEEITAAQRGKPTGYSSNVLDTWITLQLKLMRNATGIANHAFSRHFAYAGVAAYESMKPGMNGANAQWSERWNGLTGLPVAEQARNYYSPASVNAAMAAINRSMFPNASIDDKAAIDALEVAWNNEFLATQSASIMSKSIDFGKAVASAVYNWAETDGYKNANDAYTIPVGPGKWKPTPPAFANPATPYWGNNRTIIAGSTNNSQVNPPIEYSSQPGSPFYAMVKQVHDASLALTDAHKEIAMFWRDVPGVSSPGHWLSILQQVVRQTGADLEKTALAYALTGIGVNDALIICFDSKYGYSLVRPVTYIREVIGDTTWNSYLGTPAHPEYVSAHSSLSMAAAKVLYKLFGDIGSVTDHTYDYLGFTPRTFESVIAMATDAGFSRLYAGIHYIPSIQAGLSQGTQVAENIFSKNTSNGLTGKYIFR